MWKKTIAAVMTAGLLLVAAGCQNGDTATSQPAPSVDLTKELTINPSLIVGKTTFADVEKAYGKPSKAGQYETPFRSNLANGGANSKPIAEYAGVFGVDVATGKKAAKPSLLFFTNDKNKTLVASRVVFSRDELVKKEKEGKLTLDDVKKVYGEPNRGNDNGLEYYDFAHHIVMLVMKNEEAKVEALITKYDLLYADNPSDLAEHEKVIKELGDEEKAQKAAQQKPKQ
ncbi:hypothetical protein ACTID9_16350 [Brevibacillus fluminis]|uniref:hypothetical protein n=1 Tax=Brevibacillus fluminis TaxID=511487 RepID=UPI003F88C622